MPPRGFTLVELLATLTICAVLATFALPSAQRLIHEIRAETAIHAVRGALAYARATAVTHNRPVLICPLDTHDRCRGDWRDGFAVFVDLSGKAERHPDAPILRQFPALPRGASLRFAAFGTGRHLRMLPNGQTAWQNGRFEYCPPQGSRALPRILVVNVQGRGRIVRPEDIDPGRSRGAHRAVVC
ncbi:MAG: GspH/FimT family pseudopilin [Gammaproteobacteria bacterium]|nr:GspH/FimT family pseudopilin [Gammaproteobacteria bacterium]